MQTARDDYRAFKQIQESDFYKRITGSMKDTNDLTNALIKSADNQSGLNLDEILSRVGDKDRALIENGLIKNIIERYADDGITDFKGSLKELNKLPLKSQRAQGLLTQLNQNAALLNNTSEILNGLKSMNPKAYELSQGIGKSIPGRMEVMWANRAVNFIKSRIPILGNNQALKNHIVNALKNANSLNAVIKNIDEIPKQNIDSATKQGLDKFVNEVIPQIKQMIKQSEGLIKGDGFTMAKEGKLTYLDEVKFELDEVLKDKTDISDRITTSLAWLQSRHPEMFKNKRAVKELIEYVLKDPSEIKPGKSESSVYLAKRDGG